MVIRPSGDLTEHDSALASGTRLGEFEIRAVIGVGGFGIVYRAFDHDLEREVAIKEYLPGQLAGRDMTGAVTVRARTHAETFAIGLRSFVNEARLLARFDHPALLKVYRYWEAHGTAYMAMPFYVGQTLTQVMRERLVPPDQRWLMAMVEPLLGALELLHGQQIYHRDISPDNILLVEEGRPVLLDFGAARRVISDRTQTLTAILKPNYAPIEQYAEIPGLKQGPWTDLYALGAVIYGCLKGQPPSPSATRAVLDDLVPMAELGQLLHQRHGLEFSPAFLSAWQATLAIRPADRVQDVADLRRRLQGPGAVVRPLASQQVQLGAVGSVLRAQPLTAPANAPANPSPVSRVGSNEDDDADRTIIRPIARPRQPISPIQRSSAQAQAPRSVMPALLIGFGLLGLGLLLGGLWIAMRPRAPAAAPPNVMIQPVDRAQSSSPLASSSAPPESLPSAASAESLPSAAAVVASEPESMEAVQPSKLPTSPAAASTGSPPAKTGPSSPRRAASQPIVPSFGAASARIQKIPLPQPVQPTPTATVPAPIPILPTDVQEYCNSRDFKERWECMAEACRKARYVKQKACQSYLDIYGR